MKCKLTTSVLLCASLSIFGYAYYSIRTLTKMELFNFQLLEGISIIAFSYAYLKIRPCTLNDILAYLFVNFLLLTTVKYAFDNELLFSIHLGAYIILCVRFFYVHVLFQFKRALIR